MDPIPAHVAELLKTLRHPIRLPLLVALEELGEASASQLSEKRDAPFDTVNYALKGLAEEGVVEFVRVEPGAIGSNAYRRMYRPRLIGWADLLRQLDGFAADLYQ